jgi:hypothetical protein
VQGFDDRSAGHIPIDTQKRRPSARLVVSGPVARRLAAQREDEHDDDDEDCDRNAGEDEPAFEVIHPDDSTPGPQHLQHLDHGRVPVGVVEAEQVGGQAFGVVTTPDRLVLVGDSPLDPRSAEAAGSFGAAAAWGHMYDPGEPADAVLSAPGQLRPMLTSRRSAAGR